MPLTVYFVDMTDKTDIPSPDDSGSTGDQQAATSDTQLVPAQPQSGLSPVVSEIQGLAAGPSHSLGDFGKKMLAAATTQISEENLELKAENRTLRDRLDEQRNELESERVRNAVLNERIGSRHIRNLGITVGTGLVSTGLVLSRDSEANFPWLVAGIGLVVVLVSWFGFWGGKNR